MLSKVDLDVRIAGEGGSLSKLMRYHHWRCRLGIGRRSCRIVAVVERFDLMFLIPDLSDDELASSPALGDHGLIALFQAN